MTHPNLEQIALWVEDKLSSPAETQEHMNSGCVPCSEEATRLTNLGPIVREALFSNMPKETQDHLNAVVQTRIESLSAFLVASLVQDSYALEGVRGAATDTRHLRFESGDLAIVLQVEPGPKTGSSNLVGQIYAPDQYDLEGGKVQLLGEKGEALETTSDDLGEFFIDAIPEAPFTVEFSKDELKLRALIP
ncbi:MAG: hypothetical protein HKN21_16935 [Candidatus Eisenbacteria bacterium]|uniref:Uncharacterized protein n=1 Tax=Eiseniibacteriota bacterium TaxID=2212470 RepID=A0A7Y2H3T4_UNCEI|nr:hypothetical protein [Candidatus Eisenbacteria bacterium]